MGWLAAGHPDGLPGPRAHRVGLTADTLAISRSSRSKEAAWLHLQWAAGKAEQARQLAQGFDAPPRDSACAALAAASDARVNWDRVVFKYLPNPGARTAALLFGVDLIDTTSVCASRWTRYRSAP